MSGALIAGIIALLIGLGLVCNSECTIKVQADSQSLIEQAEQSE